MVFSIDHALIPPCLEYFPINPLPSKKTLWEANNEMDWQSEYDHRHEEPMYHRMTPKGDIVGLQQTPYGVQSRDVSWQEWNATQDGSGILIYLAQQVIASQVIPGTTPQFIA
jgi:hypothetical protein